MRSLLVPLILAVSVSAQSREIVVAQSPDGALHAGYTGSGQLRLWAAGHPAALGVELTGFAKPRFDGPRRLLLTRSLDDGHVERSRSHWALDLPTGTMTRIEAYAASVPQPVEGTLPVKFCLDAGHGGSDPGALGNGLEEADINLDVSLRLARLLDQDTADTTGGGTWDLLLTRAQDVFVSLQSRTDMANAFGAVTFLSIHMNAFTSPSANGTETFCYLGKSQAPGGFFRNRVQQGALAAWGLTNRGVKEANFFVLRETVMPAALLEGGFITNAGDSEKMADPAERQRLALEVLFAIQEHHGFSAYEPRLFAELEPGPSAP